MRSNKHFKNFKNECNAACRLFSDFWQNKTFRIWTNTMLTTKQSFFSDFRKNFTYLYLFPGVKWSEYSRKSEKKHLIFPKFWLPIFESEKNRTRWPRCETKIFNFFCEAPFVGALLTDNASSNLIINSLNLKLRSHCRSSFFDFLF